MEKAGAIVGAIFGCLIIVLIIVIIIKAEIKPAHESAPVDTGNESQQPSDDTSAEKPTESFRRRRW